MPAVWMAARRPILMTVGLEEHDGYGDVVIEEIDNKTNLVG